MPLLVIMKAVSDDAPHILDDIRAVCEVGLPRVGVVVSPHAIDECAVVGLDIGGADYSGDLRLSVVEQGVRDECETWVLKVDIICEERLMSGRSVLSPSGIEHIVVVIECATLHVHTDSIHAVIVEVVGV